MLHGVAIVMTCWTCSAHRTYLRTDVFQYPIALANEQQRNAVIIQDATVHARGPQIRWHAEVRPGLRAPSLPTFNVQICPHQPTFRI